MTEAHTTQPEESFMSLFDTYRKDYARGRDQAMPLDDYLALCRNDAMVYATAAERLLDAIGTPETIDTRSDPRLSHGGIHRCVPCG